MTNLYFISQNINTGYDVFTEAVVTADSFEEAQKIRPDGRLDPYDIHEDHGWTTPENVHVELIGRAEECIAAGKVICASYHAG